MRESFIVRYALLSLIQKNSQTGQYWGLSPLAEGNIAFAQIDLAKRCGAAHILCLVETVPQGVEKIADYAASLGLKWTLVRAIADISVHILADDELLLVADGLFLTSDKAAALTAERGPYVVTFVPGDQEKALVSNFERMDINHIWAGVALLRGSDLFDIRSFPDDWNIQSALLRIAVQKQYRRIVWPVRDMETGNVHLGVIADFGIGTISQSSGQTGRPSKPSFVTRLLQSGPGKMLAKRIWAMPAARLVMSALAGVFTLGAAICAYFSLPVVGILLLALGLGINALRETLFNNFLGLVEFKFIQIIQNGLSIIAFLMLLALSGHDDALIAPLFAGLVLLGLLLLTNASSQSEKASRYLSVFKSKALYLVCAIVAAALGQLVHVTMIWALLLLGGLLFERLSDEKAIETDI
jgi:hypothetical protein